VAERLTVESVTKVFPGGNQALKGPSFTVEPGTFLVLLGPSGSGKTTLLRSLAGIERITTGRIVIGDTTVAADRIHLPPERRDLSMVFQDYALWPHLCILDNVAFALRRRGHSRSTCRKMATAMIERVGLGHLSARYPGELSGGEQQRVALARALVADTGLLLCDEPLSNLDADLRERMRVEISSLVRDAGATTIYITHDQLEAFALADHVGVLQEGRLVQLDTPEEVYASPSTPFVARFTGLAGELPVRVRGPGEPGHTVSVEPTGIPCARPVEARIRRDPDPGEGEQSDRSDAGVGILAIRPTAVRLCAPGSDISHFNALVADVAFRGRHYELAVDLEGGVRLSGVQAEHRVARGTAVGLALEPSGCMVFAGRGAIGSTAGPDPAVNAPSTKPDGRQMRMPVLSATAGQERSSVATSRRDRLPGVTDLVVEL